MLRTTLSKLGFLRWFWMGRTEILRQLDFVRSTRLIFSTRYTPKNRPASLRDSNLNRQVLTQTLQPVPLQESAVLE